MDGAMYAPALPIIKTFGERHILDYVHSFSFSLHKMFGMSAAAAVVITNEEYDNDVFGGGGDMIEYVTMQDRLTVAGTRTGFLAVMAYKTLETFKVDKGSEGMEKIVNHNLGTVKFFTDLLATIYSPEEVRSKIFNVFFPKKWVSQEMIDSY
jgi:glutamate/tyrosine decarboxylase-like PLP-dependent enzyme